MDLTAKIVTNHVRCYEKLSSVAWIKQRQPLQQHDYIFIYVQVKLCVFGILLPKLQYICLLTR